MLKIAVIGCGFVGKAVISGFTKDVECYSVDPMLNTSIDSMYKSGFNPDLIFVSVPTPMGDDGTIDSSIIEEVVLELSNYEWQPIVIIKSTVTPEVLNVLQFIYDRLVFNPEFLTERNAAHDFIHANMLVLGGKDKEDLEYVKQQYDLHSICEPCPTYYMDLQAAAMVKYALNSFLATKVLFFNQFKEIFDSTKSTLNWDDFTSVVSTDNRIGKSHLQIPGPDGRLGYGGACFLKDTAALIRYAETQGLNFSQLKETVKSNQVIRSKYTERDAREIAQNAKVDLSI